MANVILQQGSIDFLNAILATGDDLFSLDLYQNNHVPAVNDTNASYTVADFSGYAQVTLNGFWGSPYINGNGQAEIDNVDATFTHNGGGTSNTIYGIYVSNASGDVQYAERFPAPIVMASLGDTIDYTPKFTAASA